MDIGDIVRVNVECAADKDYWRPLCEIDGVVLDRNDSGDVMVCGSSKLHIKQQANGRSMGQRDAQRGLAQGNLRGLPVPDASPAPYFCRLPIRYIKFNRVLDL